MGTFSKHPFLFYWHIQSFTIAFKLLLLIDSVKELNWAQEHNILTANTRHAKNNQEEDPVSCPVSRCHTSPSFGSRHNLNFHKLPAWMQIIPEDGSETRRERIKYPKCAITTTSIRNKASERQNLNTAARSTHHSKLSRAVLSVDAVYN